MPAEKILGSGFLAGAFIGYGAYLACTVGGACPGLVAENPGLQPLGPNVGLAPKVCFGWIRSRRGCVPM